MSLKDKYKSLIDYAGSPKVDQLSVSENNNVLYISGSAPASVKDKIWEMYNSIDPDMRAGDMVLDIKSTDEGKTTGNVQSEGNGEAESYTIKPGDSLSKIANNYPGMTWQKIYDANKDTIKDPNVIYPGKTIRIPKA
ncbi:MAG: LysM peptidoglycan-binding domain-containing protein [Bacteroidales bacterium]|nr:LysM peptidoglycan-binding domain-containing protein [Bacteroidales bacterium]